VSEELPIIVKLLRGPNALRIACERCGAEVNITPDDLNQEATWDCPRACGGEAIFKYVEADHECPSCGKLGFFPDGLAPCCSRRCMLQVEHAARITDASL
jgi:hypothetical protein